QQIVSRYIDSIKRCENRGVFGVRKTGKTSLLFKIDRIVREQHLGFVFYYDCKSPSYRKFHWNELLGEICDNIAKRLKIRINRNYDEKNIIKSFRYVMKEASIRNKKVVIIFDEIEYISFKSPLDPHWKTEYIEFWQTMWSVQSLHRNLVFIISGVNASVTEVDMINGVQNPLFGIVQSEYLQGLSSEETHVMVRTLGKRMGLKFSYDTIEFLFNQYNGHPMLTRLACSYIGRQFSDDLRPVDIVLDIVQKMQEDIDIDLAYYFKHIVSEIQQFYPDEYEMFELLASGQTSDFVELSA
ncbi:AAA-like domain-containing protein, partial [Mordavella massiliensis]|nr:AAA-like domain-containing protein [Mordavella massiliensis]